VIAKLTGRVDSLADGSAVIDVAGVGYLVFCSGRTLARLVEGRAAVLLVETQVREDGIHLYGFFDAEERRWFRLLIAIQGVGPKVALAMLGVLAPEELALAIGSGDRTSLTRAAGVGAKLAARIVSELKDKIGALPVSAGGAALATGVTAVDGGLTADAVSALVNLGFRPIEAQGAVAAASGRLGPEVALDALIRSSLAELANKEQRA
jgi:Holliday junction DNA helicase RuvA